MRITAKSCVLPLIVSVGCVPAAAQRRNSSQRNIAATANCSHKEEDEKNLFCPAKEEKGETKTQPSAEQAAIVNSKDQKGCTPLMRAAENGDLRAVQELLKAGADVNDKLGHLSSDGSTWISPTDTRLWPGISALILAAKEGQLEIVKVLLAAGADPNGKLVSFRFGFETPLMFAIDPCTKNRFAIMNAMIAGGAEVNPKTGGASPLTYAVSKRDKIMIKALIARGADINLADANGTTPLMSAVLGSDPNMVRFLLAAGADVNAQNLKGETALAIVRRLKRDFPNSEQDEIIRLLKNATHRPRKTMMRAWLLYGFPCQPLGLAPIGLGKLRHCWVTTNPNRAEFAQSGPN